MDSPSGHRRARVVAIAASLFSEGASGFLPLLIIPVLIWRLGSEAYALTLPPLVVAAFLVSGLDLGLTLGMPALWRGQPRSIQRSRYVVAATVLRLLAAAVAAVVFVVLWLLLASPASSVWAWLGGYFVLVGQLMFPAWLFIVSGRTALGQALNAAGKVLPVVALFFLLRPDSAPAMVNASYGGGAVAASCLGYLVLLRAPEHALALPAWRRHRGIRRLCVLLLRRNRSLWASQLTQSTYRTSLPLVATASLAPTSFLAFSVSEKCLRACQSVQAYILQYDQSRIIRDASPAPFVRRLIDKTFSYVVPLSVLLAVGYYFSFVALAPAILGGDASITEQALDIHPILTGLVIVGGLNYWLGTVGLPAMGNGSVLLDASAIAGASALSVAAAAYLAGSLHGFALAMACGELVFLAVVLLTYRLALKHAR